MESLSVLPCVVFHQAVSTQEAFIAQWHAVSILFSRSWIIALKKADDVAKSPGFRGVGNWP